MKTLFISLSILMSVHLLANELDWVDEQVAAIKPPRSGMTGREISSIKNPFIFLKKDTTKKSSKTAKKTSGKKVKRVAKAQTSFILKSVINNSALINGTWYKEGQVISGYKVAEINPQTVLLTKHKKKLLLSTRSKNQTLNFNNK
jgi:hypothetical protein